MSQTLPDESVCQAGGADCETPTASVQHLHEPALDLIGSQPQDQPVLADSNQNQSQDSDRTEDLPTVEDDIAAALETDLDLSDAVPLEEVPAVSLEEQVASALERASTSLPHLSSASCSLESFKSGTAYLGNYRPGWLHCWVQWEMCQPEMMPKAALHTTSYPLQI